MRIVIMGDLQYEPDENINEIFDDINSLSADTVVCTGDYGWYSGYGSYEVFNKTAKKFKMLNAKNVIPLLGNHDIQYEAGERQYKNGTVFRNYQKAFGYLPENRFINFDDFRLFCINTDIISRDDCIVHGENYISKESINKLKSELEKFPDKPVIMVTHAPVAGCGLLTVPQVHIRYSNAYINQDHNYKEWIEIARKYRQIIMWFNGHYHMGHNHEKSMSEKDELTYFVTGSVTNQCRDGQRHTRIIDVENRIITVSTYDHDTKEIYKEPDCVQKIKIRGKYEKEVTNTIFEAGCGKVLNMQLGKNGKVYAMTDCGFLWEIDVDTKITTGTLHYSDKYTLDGFVTDDKHIWRICGNKVFGHKYNNPQRFMREKDYSECQFEIRNKTTDYITPEPFIYQERVACKLSDGHIITAYNIKEKLYFEIL